MNRVDVPAQLPPVSVLRAPTAANGKKIAKAAQEFEAVLLTSLFQQMQHSVSTQGDGEQDFAGDIFRDIGVQELASSAAASGGVGIAKMIVPYLSKSTSNSSE